MNMPKGIDLFTLMVSRLHLDVFKERRGKGCLIETNVEMSVHGTHISVPRVGQLDKTEFEQTRQRCHVPIPSVGVIWSMLWSDNLVLSTKT